MNPRKGYRENVAEQERRMIELEHKLEVARKALETISANLTEDYRTVAAQALEETK